MILNVNSIQSVIIPAVSIGYVGEENVYDITFDYTEWVEDYGSGVLTLAYTPPGSSVTDIIALELIAEGMARWNIEKTDVASKGKGEAQLTYVVDGKTKKNEIFPILVKRSLESSVPQEEPYTRFLSTMIALGSETKQNARDAATSALEAAESAEAAKQSEVNAAESESNAGQYARDAADSMETAGNHAYVAVASAEAAGQSETNAGNSALAAAASEGKASDSAISAAESAANAYSFANSAEESANAAARSETNAETSEQNAADSEEGASISARNAAASEANAANKALDAEAWSVGKRNGTDVEATDPTYHNSAKFYAEQAELSVNAGGFLNVEIRDGKLYALFVNMDTINLQMRNGGLYAIYG